MHDNKKVRKRKTKGKNLPQHKCSSPNVLFALSSRIRPLFKTCHSPSSLTGCICTGRYEVEKWKRNIYATVFFNYSLFLFILCFKLFIIHYHTQKQRKTKINWNERSTTTLRLPNLVSLKKLKKVGKAPL